MNLHVSDSLLGALSLVGASPYLPPLGALPLLRLFKQIHKAVSRGRTSSRGGAPSGGKALSSNVLHVSLGRIFGRVAPKNLVT